MYDNPSGNETVRCSFCGKTQEEVKKIGKGLEELNKGAIIATNSSLFIKIMLKVAVFNLLALIF